MTDHVRALVPPSFVRHLTRREALARGAAALGLSAWACRGSGGSGEAGLGGQLAVYTWAEYHSPENVSAFADATGLTVTFDIFESNEAMLAKLELAGPAAGYDVVVPNTSFVPLMVARGLLARLDHARIPHLANQEEWLVRMKNGPQGDPDGAYTVVKDWGSTGFIYDTTVIDGELSGWADFVQAAARPGVSRRVSLLPSPAEVAGAVFWRDGIPPDTVDPGHLDHAERVLLADVAPHVKAFDVYPALGMLGGEYALAQCWNGDARKAVIDAPDRLRWVLGAPKTNLWVAVFAVLAGAPHPEAAHAFIDYMLQPDVSAREVVFTGNATGVKGVEAALPADLPARDVIFFTEAERARLVPEVVNEAQPRLVDIYNKVRLAAGRS
jgi:spermidine/putrescine transport system substrate-binding protein